MATAETQAPTPLTAEEFGRRPDPGYPEELERGRIVRMPPPKARHGQVCGQTYYLLRRHIEDRDLGHLLSNDAGIVTGRGPDTVRGADVAFYSYARVPRGPLPAAYLAVAPELVVEVLSPDDRWPRVLAKVAEYLGAGVAAVVVLEPEGRTAYLYRAEHPPRTLGPDEELTIPEVLPEFRAAVRRFFE